MAREEIMNWKLIAKHFANGKLDRKSWAIQIWVGGPPFWDYIGTDLQEHQIDKAVERMEKKYGKPDSNDIELCNAGNALGIPMIL